MHLWIVDLFAGGGWHRSRTRPEERRPGTAPAAVFRLWQTVRRGDWPFEVRAHMVAVDADESLGDSLRGVLDKFAHANLSVEVITRNCAEVIEDVRRRSVGGYTLWLFDPYGLESIPFCLVQQVLSPDKTEVLVNLDAGNATRPIDAAAKKAGTYDLRWLDSRTLDCLFGGDAWRGLPAEYTTTARRQEWLANRYAGLFPTKMHTQALVLESTSGSNRYFVQAAGHPTAVKRFRKSYDDQMKLWKKPREELDDVARSLARELAGQAVTPELVASLGIVPGASRERVRWACEHAVALDLATHADGTFTFRPPDEQPGARKGLFD